MQRRASNASLVAVLLLAFTLFVAGLTKSTDGDRLIQAAATATPTRTPTPVNIGNFVWRDLNANSVQDAGEPGMQGVTVQLWNSTKSAMIDDAVTNASGIYTVVSPGPGSVYLRVITGGLPLVAKDAGGSDTADSDANADGFTDLVVLASNLISTTTVDFGFNLRYAGYVPLTPARLVDTRSSGVTIDGVNQIGQRAAGSTLTLQVGGRGGVLPSAIAVTLNVTAAGPAGNGFFTVYPCQVARPTASSLNTSGVTIANEVNAQLSPTGTVCIYTSVTTHIVVDVVGQFVG